MTVTATLIPEYRALLTELCEDLLGVAALGPVEAERVLRGLLDSRSESAVASRLREVRAAILRDLIAVEARAGGLKGSQFRVARAVGMTEPALSKVLR